MPRGVYTRKPRKPAAKVGTKVGKVRIPADVAAQLFPGRKSARRQLSLTASIPSDGLMFKVNDRKGRTIVTLDINDEGISVYPANKRRSRKAQPRIRWANFTQISGIFGSLIG